MPIILSLYSFNQDSSIQSLILNKIQNEFPICLSIREERRGNIFSLYYYLPSRIEYNLQSNFNELKQSINSIRKDLERYKIDILFIDRLLDPHQESLFVFDMDSTLIQEEVIDELARMNGRYEEVAQVTKKAMEGGLQFEKALALRVQHLQGLEETCFQKLFQNLHLNPGVEETLFALKNEYKAKRAVLSGGFLPILKMFSEKYNLDYFEANHLIVKNGFLTGELEGRIVGKERKKQALIELREKWNIHPNQVVAIGDGANDSDMLNEAAIGIGFHAKQGLKDKIINWVDFHSMEAILLLFSPSL